MDLKLHPGGVLSRHFLQKPCEGLALRVKSAGMANPGETKVVTHCGGTHPILEATLHLGVRPPL